MIEANILVSLPCTKFKILQKSLGRIWVFVNDIWKKFCNANQYKLVDVIDRSTYIEYFEYVSKKFDGIIAHINNFLIQYFWDSLKPFIHTQ